MHKLKLIISQKNTDIVHSSSSSSLVELSAGIEVPVVNSSVKVVVEGEPPGEHCTKPRQHSIRVEHYAVASTLVRGGAGYLRNPHRSSVVD